MTNPLRSFPRPSPGFYWTLAALTALWLAIAGPVLPQAKPPGVGLPGVPRPDFSRHWCEERKPPGRPATCTSLAPAGFDCRICPSTGWQGAYAELAPATEKMLRRCWELDTWGTRQTHQGSFTEAEFSWAVLALGKGHAYYRTCWWPWEVGGQHNPIVVSPATESFHEYRHECMVAKGAWPPAGEVGSYIGLDPVSRVDICVSRFVSDTARPVWSVYVKNDLPPNHPWNQGSTPPVPVPPPPPPPTCEPLSTSEFSRLCAAKGQTLEQCERTASRPGATGRLAQAWAKVCREPTPPPTCAECEAGGFRDPLCAGCPCPPELVDAGVPLQPLPGRHCTPVPPVKLCPRFRVIVTPEVVTLPQYVPGIPSTGKLEIGLEPMEWGPCP